MPREGGLRALLQLSPGFLNPFEHFPRALGAGLLQWRWLPVMGVKEVLPPSLDSTADPPLLFDGTTRFHLWSTTMKSKERVLICLLILILILKVLHCFLMIPQKGSLLRSCFLIVIHSTIVSFKAVTSDGDLEKEIGPAYDKIEDALSKFDDGCFFLGQFSLVDVAYAPFIERFQLLFAEVKSYDITKGRPKLAMWIEELNKIEAYKQTVRDPQELLEALKKTFGIN